MPSLGPDQNDRGLTKGSFVEACFTVQTNGFARFFGAIGECIRRVETTGAWGPGQRRDGTGEGMSGHLRINDWRAHGLEAGLKRLKREALARHRRGKKVIFIGNGGSAAIASHMAVDWTKNGGMRSVALNDAPTLTCMANDFGYEHAFAKLLEFYAQPGDLVIIISSSGRSPNVIATAHAANALDLDSVRLTGMDPDNKLRRGGRLNFYVPCEDYGLVELTHLCLLHAVVSVQ